jgi:ABC-type oligopeptide transport system ATPase subunit
MAEVVLEIINLTRRFGTFTAVDALTLSVSAGEVFGLLGSNGAGKTTTIKMLTTLLPPTSGEARVAGFSITTQPVGVRRAIGYVTAQRQYASANPATGGAGNYAQKFKSTPGKKDGLYWAAGENEAASPVGPLVAEAQAEGYVTHKGAGPHPFHGYYFKILTRQGEAAPGGKMNYMSDGSLTGGFALVAYPEHWDQSGIMTFIVNQDGKVYQRNLAEKTSRMAGAIKEYNPDSNWTLVPDEGVLSAASEK